MTLLDLPLPDRPSRSGEPWTEECLAELVTLLLEGLDVRAIALRAGRTPSTVLMRLRRMLPADERGCPEPLVPPRLRELLATEDYDWRRTMLKDAPPRPIHQPPAVHREGVAGLEADDLVEIADALVRTQARDDDLLERVRLQVLERGLGERLVDRRVRELVRATPTYHHEEEFRMAAEQWVTHGLGGPVGPSSRWGGAYFR